LLYTSGDAAFRLEDFSAAAAWFEKAYSNISEDFGFYFIVNVC
jgi:hypothetical protein